jgi:outer membrane protein
VDAEKPESRLYLNPIRMKFIRIIPFLFLNFFVLAINAQVFIGGNFDASISNRKDLDNSPITTKTTGYSFNVSPTVGKFLSDKVAMGIRIGAGFSLSDDQIIGQNRSNRSKGYNLGASPFVRYYFKKWDKFALFETCILGFNYAKSEYFQNGVPDPPSRLNYYSIDFHPGISYSLSDKLDLEGEIGFLNLGYTYTISNRQNIRNYSSAFNIAGGSLLGTITIGAIYKFGLKE